jgi:hypothetical protein
MVRLSNAAWALGLGLGLRGAFFDLFFVFLF